MVEFVFIISYRYAVGFGRALANLYRGGKIIGRECKVYFGVCFRLGKNNVGRYGSLFGFYNPDGCGGFAAVEIRLRANGDSSVFRFARNFNRIAV